MHKIKGTSTAAISNADLASIMEKGRGRDQHKARMEQERRARRANLRVVRGALDVECPHCNAKAGEPCVTASGAKAKAMHKARIELV